MGKNNQAKDQAPATGTTPAADQTPSTGATTTPALPELGQPGAGDATSQADPSAQPDPAPPTPPDPPEPGKSEKFITVVLRHKTPYEVYRRVGLTLRAQAAEYQVTKAQLEILKADKWVEVKAK